MQKDYIIGVSLGKPNQYSAMVVIDCDERPKEPPTYGAVKIERFTAGTAYKDIAERLQKGYEHLRYAGIPEDARLDRHDHRGVIIERYRPSNRRTVVIERTQAGEAVMKLMQAGIQHQARGIFVSHASRATAGDGTIPEQDIRDALLLAYQAKRVRFSPGIPENETLFRQAQDFCSERGKLQPGTEELLLREGAADDLMWAWAVAIWEGERRNRTVFDASLICKPARSAGPPWEMRNPYGHRGGRW